MTSKPPISMDPNFKPALATYIDRHLYNYVATTKYQYPAIAFPLPKTLPSYIHKPPPPPPSYSRIYFYFILFFFVERARCALGGLPIPIRSPSLPFSEQSRRKKNKLGRNCVFSGEKRKKRPPVSIK